MDKKMTLEQVKDVATHALDCIMDYENSAKVADAIDAELKARGEPVAAVCDTDQLYDGFIAWRVSQPVPIGTKLYVATPAPKIEVTPDFVHSVLEHYPLDASGHFRTLSPVRLAVALEAALKETP